MNGLLEDVRYGSRMLCKNPGFTAVALIVLALGTGANTAVFSVFNAVILRPLPYFQPESLYKIEGMTPLGPTNLSSPDVADFRERTEVFEKMAAARRVGRFLTGTDEPEQLAGVAVGRECLPLLGTMPFMGRWFTDEDFGPGAPQSVIIGQGLWQRRFHGDPQIIGKSVQLNGVSHTVVAVMPPEFQFTDRRFEFWIPLQITSEELGQRDLTAFMLLARARQGVTRRQVESEAVTTTRYLVRQFPADHRNWQARAVPLDSGLGAEARRTLLLLLGAVGFVLLIACLNVASLLLARGTDRCREVATRVALGAGRTRVVRQLLTESVLLGLMSALPGILLASWADRALVSLFSERARLPRMEQTGIDGTVLAFTLLLAAFSSLLFGLVPALRVSSLNLNQTLKETGRSTTGNIRARRVVNAIVVAEVAFSLILLVGAGLMLRTLYNIIRTNPGFKTERILTARLPMPAYRLPDENGRPAYYMEMLRRVQSLPGVVAAGLATVIPLSGGEVTMTIRTTKDSGESSDTTFHFRAVSPAYFRTMSVPFTMGRDFTDSDTADASRVAVVNEALARQLWPGENPIGKQIRAPKPATVVGVVSNIRHTELSAPPQPELYLPYVQFLGTPNTMLVVRTMSDPISMVGSIRKAIRDYQPDQPIVDMRTMKQVVADSVAQPRLYTLLIGVFAALAVVLVSAGVYGVMAYTVSQRSHEIGVRMALGAPKHRIVGEIVAKAMRYVVAGIVIGVAAALAATRVLSGQLFGVTRTDPATYVSMALFLLVWALAAIYIPARRASRVDPLVALRHE